MQGIFLLLFTEKNQKVETNSTSAKDLHCKFRQKKKNQLTGIVD